MSDDDLGIEELERLLQEKRRAQRRVRLDRLRAEGRLVDVPDLPPPTAVPRVPSANIHSAPAVDAASPPQTGRLRRLGNGVLLLVEIAAVVGLVLVFVNLWQSNRELNQELTQIQQDVFPTPTATPVIDVVILPSGHQPPVAGRAPQPGEAGDIPEHLLPAINAYQPPPVPTPGPQQARRIQIARIGVDHPIVQGDDWEQLKKGVGQHIGSGQVGETGNMVLSAHNDIYGEIFRHLDQLAPGDEIVVSTQSETHTYVVTRVAVVQPTDVWVMAPTDHAQVTLISCYPYRINTQRIVVFADLVDNASTSG